MIKILYSALLFVGIAAQAQSFEWLKTPATNFQYNPDMIGYCTATDDAGNLYFTGFKDTPFLYQDIMGTMYFNKYNSSGELQFSKTLTGHVQVYNVVTDHDGNVLMAIGWVNEVTVNEVSLSTLDQGVQWMLVKFNQDGNLLWHKELAIDEPEGSGLNWVQDFRAIAVDGSNNVYIGYDNFSSSYISKLSPEGAELDVIEQQGVSRITSVSVDTEGNIYAAGGCAGWQPSFAGVPIDMPANLQYNTYLVKYSGTGEYQWVKFVEDVTCSEAHVVAKSPDEVYFSGPLNIGNFFDCFYLEGDAGFDGDFYLAKINSSGMFEWARETPGDGNFMLGNRNFLSLDAEGAVYLSGRASAGIDWGNNIISGGNGLYKTAIVLKYNPQGDVVMAKTATSDWMTRFDGVSVAHDGAIYVAGMGYGNGTFDDITYTPQTENSYYPFAAKINSTTSGVDNTVKVHIALYPNPAGSTISISGIDRPLKGSIYNVLGQKVKDFEVSVNESISVNALPIGTYFLKADNMKALKFVKE